MKRALFTDTGRIAAALAVMLLVPSCSRLALFDALVPKDGGRTL